MPVVHDLYFAPKHEAFMPRNLWSLSNAFTSAFKKLAPTKQFEATARLGAYLADVQKGLKFKYQLEFNLQKDGTLMPVEGVKRTDFGIEDFDEEDVSDETFNDEFDEYFDEEEATEAIDEAEDEMIQEYKRRVAA